ELLDGALLALDDCLDLAAGQVADLTEDAEALRLLLGAGPVEDALHATGDDHLRAGHSSSSAKPFSSTTRTPSSWAFFSFEPASSPATTRSVFLLTVPATRPPRRSISAFAWSRVYRERVPVRTTVFPENAPAASRAASASGATPAASKRS